MLIAGFVSGFILDRFGHLKSLNIVGNILIALTMVIFSLSTDIVQVISAFFIFYLALGISGSPSSVLANRVLTTHQNYGKEISILNSTTNIGSCLIGAMAPSVIAFGEFFSKSDGYLFFFLILAVLAFCSAIFISKVNLADNVNINKQPV